MAERLDTFDFDSLAHGGRKGGHPWDDWLDGNPWRLTQGQDFAGSLSNFAGLAWKRARERGLGLRSHRDTSGGMIVIQAVPLGD